MKHVKNFLHIIFSAVILLTLYSCTPEEDIETGSVNINFNFGVDGNNIAKDIILYENEAGNQFGVTEVRFFVSELTLVAADGSEHVQSGYFLVDMDNPASTTLTIEKVPYGEYTGAHLHVGLPADLNDHNAMPSTEEIDEMIWSNLLGGGYHFMMFNGNYIAEDGSTVGFAMHLGKNDNYKICNMSKDFDHTTNATTLTMTMNLNEWFRNPNTYDIDLDGRLIMSNDPSLKKLGENGHNVFTIE